jgi:hypothetical protein
MVGITYSKREKKKREKKKNGEKLNKQVYFISLTCVSVTNLIMSVGEYKKEELKIQQNQYQNYTNF